MPPRIEHIFENGIEKKRCSNCKQYLDLDNFVYKEDRWDNLHNECNICCFIRNKRRYKPEYNMPEDINPEDINKVYGQKQRRKVDEA